MTKLDITADEAEALAKELTELSKHQLAALQTAAYIRMSEPEAKKYDERRLRIGEIWEILGKFKADSIHTER